ncbi:MAG: glycosyltransferase family 39 protein [Phycisphaerales bacterium]|nr:glycosyltransferase family 39 protein [Phycisphaerales bacterium]MCB9856753.1 glycosyltransferase family 39 protein [Phycisphaerales bacterium]MCB9862120.1 glycosyltransferase family 39 protein [Phycisphaerales bacterium]
MTSPSHRIHIPTFLVIVVVAAIFRAGIAAPEACISRDGVWFVEMARKLADDPVRHMRIETKQPGFSWTLLAAQSAMGGKDTPEGWQATGKLIAGIGGVAVCALVYFLALRLFDPTTAAVAGLFAAFWSQGAQLSADVLSDMPHLAIYLAAMALLAAGPEKRALFRWPIAGAVIGLAYWFRLEAIGLLPAVAIWAVVALPREQRRRAIAPIVLFGLAFAVVAGPYVVMARWPGARSNAIGAEHADTKASVAWNSDAPSELKLPRLSASLAVCSGSALPLANPVAPVKLPGRMAEEWARSGRYVFAALFLAGLFVRSTPRGTRPLAWLCGLVAVFQLLLVAARVLKYGELSSRYMLVPIALTIPWAAAAFAHLVRLAILRSTDTSKYKFVPIWATGLMLALFPMIYYGIRPINAGRLDLRAAGCWLRDAVAKDDVILADDQNLSQVQYYADRIYPNAATWEQIERQAGEAARTEAIRRIRPAWFVTMIDTPGEPVDAAARAAALCEQLPGYVLARIFESDARPVIVLRRNVD